MWVPPPEALPRDSDPGLVTPRAFKVHILNDEHKWVTGTYAFPVWNLNNFTHLLCLYVGKCLIYENLRLSVLHCSEEKKERVHFRRLDTVPFIQSTDFPYLFQKKASLALWSDLRLQSIPIWLFLSSSSPSSSFWPAACAGNISWLSHALCAFQD